MRGPGRRATASGADHRGGNRALNCALHMIAVTQACGTGPGRKYIEQAQARGKSRTEAIRLLRRQLSDTAFSALRTDERATGAAQHLPPAIIPAAV